MRKFTGIFILIIIYIFLQNYTSAQQQNTNDLNGWFKAGSRPDSYKIGVNSEKYNDDKTYYIKSTDTVTNGFGTIMKMDDAAQYYGKRVKMSAYIKTINVNTNAGMWMRVDSKEPGKMLGFDNMQKRPVTGTTDWKKYEIILNVPENSFQLAFGLLINNEGEAWFSEPSFDIVGIEVPTTNILIDDPSVFRKYNDWFKAGSLPNSYELGFSDDKYNGGTTYYLKSIAKVTEGFGTIMKSMYEISKYLGKRLRLTGYIKTENLDDYAAMWMRVDGGDNPGKSLSFDNMHNRPIKGTNDWKKYEIVLDVPANSTGISYGVLIDNNGQVTINELKLEIVGTDVPTTNEK